MLTYCQTPVLGLGLGVDFVFPLSQQEQQEQQEEEQPLTKIYMKEEYYRPNLNGVWHLRP